jgi:hypothetical protein
MPANKTVQLDVNTDAGAVVALVATLLPTVLAPAGSASWSLQDTTLRLSKIPLAGSAGVGTACFVVLPVNPKDGDEYEVIDADGSCGPTSPILVTPNPNNPTATINGLAPAPLSTFAITSAFAGFKLKYDGNAKNWNVTLTGTIGVPGALANLAGTAIGGGPVAPANFAGGAAINLCAFLVKANSGAGAFRLTFTLKAVVAAADAGLLLAVQKVTNVTAFSGGSQVGGANAPTFRFETGTGAGQPVVCTGDAPTTYFTFDRQVVAGQLTDTYSFTLLIPIPPQTNPLALGTGVVITIADTAQVVSAMSLETDLQAAA